MPAPRSRRRPSRLPARLSPSPSPPSPSPPSPSPSPSAPSLTARLQLRRLWNTVNLTTPAGLALARGPGCRVRRGPEGLHLATGYRWPFSNGGAFTVGNVVLIRPPTALTPRLLGHESRHSTQYAWCAGLPFLPLYALAAGWSLLGAGDTASANVFERHAGLAAGEYRERPVRRPRRVSRSRQGPAGTGNARASGHTPRGTRLGTRQYPRGVLQPF